MDIYTVYNELVDIENIKPNPRNPNKHPKKQIELLAKIIKEQGWRTAITVSRRSGYIVRGHARLAAAKMLGEKQVPVDLQDYESDEMEMADLVADNRIAELADMSGSGLRDILQELDTGAIDIELTGYTHEDMEKMIEEVVPVDIDKLIQELDVTSAVQKPIWLSVRTSAENQEILERVAALLEQQNIRVERSYET